MAEYPPGTVPGYYNLSTTMARRVGPTCTDAVLCDREAARPCLGEARRANQALRGRVRPNHGPAMYGHNPFSLATALDTGASGGARKGNCHGDSKRLHCSYEQASGNTCQV
jgi:hypothetical protein